MATIKAIINGMEIEIEKDSRLAKQLENAVSDAMEAATQKVRDEKFTSIKAYLAKEWDADTLKTLNGYSLVVNFDSGRIGSKELSGIVLTKRVKLLQRTGSDNDSGN